MLLIKDGANQDKIDWNFLSIHPNAIPLLEANQDKINWSYLSQNPGAIHLLQANQDKINWPRVSLNPSIFQCDYTFYRERMDVHREELMKKVYHPKRLTRYLKLGYDFDDL